MRRLPIYFLLDVSESMIGEPIRQVEDGIRTIIQELRTDPYALETVFVSVIAFAGKAKMLVPLTELFKFYPPNIPIGGGTSLGGSLEFLMKEITQSVQPTTPEIKGDWKPIVFLFTDGTPTDNPVPAFDKWVSLYKRKCNLVAISIGENVVDTCMLGKLTPNVLRLKDTDETSFKAFFKWVTQSIKSTSMSVCEGGSDDVPLAPVDGINLEKVDVSKHCKVDENWTVLIGKCQTTRKTYLIKFGKRIGIPDIDAMLGSKPSDFKLLGAYPVDEDSYNSLSEGSQRKQRINTSQLWGCPTCPCCGNQLGAVSCKCGNIFCAGENPQCTCPWCGEIGRLSTSDSGGLDINRTLG